MGDKTFQNINKILHEILPITIILMYRIIMTFMEILPSFVETPHCSDILIF